MRDGYCKYGYKRDHISAAELSEDGYPLYRRRSPEEHGNVCFKYRGGKNLTYTNADVVPYNKYLLFKYDCHINVEYCHSINAIKYLFKYINKGQDMATFTVDEAHKTQDDQDEQARDEVQEFQNSWYPGEAENAWRLRQNELADREPSACRLQLHLEGEQTVYFDSNSKTEDCIERIERSERTKLTAFFELNDEPGDDKLVRTLLYREMPQHYTWDTWP
ncbi:hypothetical protein ACHAWF_001528 [Thalassiosira exigua]